MARDGYRLLCEHLLPEEAGMAQGLLQSAGIEALVEDLHLSSVDPLVRLAISGAKVLVPVADVEKAREVLAAGGVAMRGGAPVEPVEIPEEEWSKPPDEVEQPSEPPTPLAARVRALLWLVFGAILIAMLLRALRVK